MVHTNENELSSVLLHVYDNMGYSNTSASVAEILELIPECLRETVTEAIKRWFLRGYDAELSFSVDDCPSPWTGGTSCEHGVGNAYRIYVRKATLDDLSEEQIEILVKKVSGEFMINNIAPRLDMMQKDGYGTGFIYSCLRDALNAEFLGIADQEMLDYFESEALEQLNDYLADNTKGYSIELSGEWHELLLMQRGPRMCFEEIERFLTSELPTAEFEALSGHTLATFSGAIWVYATLYSDRDSSEPIVLKSSYVSGSSVQNPENWFPKTSDVLLYTLGAYDLESFLDDVAHYKANDVEFDVSEFSDDYSHDLLAEKVANATVELTNCFELINEGEEF